MFELYYYQQEAVNSIFEYFWGGNKGNPLIVAPTGSGKSVIIAGFCQEVVQRWSNQKILILSHVQEILEQDFAAIQKQIPNKKIGLYSAGLGSKQVKDITVAGIQSVHAKPHIFDGTDLIICDEAHSISPEQMGMYRKLFTRLRRPVIGFTATPFRLGYGYLHLGKDAFFSDIVCNIPLETLEVEGYVCPLTTKGTDEKMDASGIKKQAGDYVLRELSLAFDRIEITKKIITECIKHKEKRKKWLMFCIDIEHADHVAAELNKQGVTAAAIHSKMPNKIRSERIGDFKKDKYQALASVGVLTTGFDEKRVDLIGLLRATTSPVLHCQILGRGRRPHIDKENCLVLDFAGNMARIGSDKNPVIKLKGEKGGGEPIMKECPSCREMVHAAVRDCPVCKFKFKFRHHLNSKAFKDKTKIQAWHHVDSVEYDWYSGSRGIPMMLVRYICGLRTFKEYICVEHGGKATYRASWWWKRRHHKEMPPTAELAVKWSPELKVPKEILIIEEAKFPEIKEFTF